MARSVTSPATAEALGIMAAAIRSARLGAAGRSQELAERVGVSHPTIVKVERGDPSVAAGTLLEAATVVGVPLFDPDPANRERYGASKRTELVLLPMAARRRRTVDDDF